VEEEIGALGTLTDPNKGKGRTLREKAVDMTAGFLQEKFNLDQYESYKIATNFLGNYNAEKLQDIVGALDFTPLQLPFALEEGKRAYDRGDYVEGVAGLGLSALEMVPGIKLLTKSLKPIASSVKKKLGALPSGDMSDGIQAIRDSAEKLKSKRPDGLTDSIKALQGSAKNLRDLRS